MPLFPPAITALTGDVTASGPGSAAATLANTAVSAGSYTNTSITVDAKGRLTAASSGSSGGLTVGTTAITGGTFGNVFYHNGSVLGEMTVSGTGTVLMATASPTTTGTLTAATVTASGTVTANSFSVNGLSVSNSGGFLSAGASLIGSVTLNGGLITGNLSFSSGWGSLSGGTLNPTISTGTNCNLYVNPNGTGSVIFSAGSASGIPIIVKAAASRTASLLQLQTSAGASLGNVGGSIFDHFADGGSTHTDGTEDTLYTDTTAANTLIINGDQISAEYTVAIVGSATATRRIQVYFAGTNIGDTTALTYATTGNVKVYVTIIRATSTTAIATVEFTYGAGLTHQADVFVTALSGLTLTGTNILKITGIAASTGAASGDITAKIGKVNWLSESAA